MNHIEAIFAAAAPHRRLIIPYICAGDPDAATSGAILNALHEAGAEIAEVGMPFSDPVADGRSIQTATQRALQGGMSMNGVFELCANAERAPAAILFGYLNPIARYGLERFAQDAGRAGVRGAIIADLPYEEAPPVRPVLHRAGIGLTLLIAPSTPPDRAARIAEVSDGFVYVVSRLGVTGASREPDFEGLATQLQTLRARTGSYIAAGFGISSAEHVRAIAPYADAMVVGSALVDAIAGRIGIQAAEAARTFMRPLIDAARRPFAGSGDYGIDQRSSTSSMVKVGSRSTIAS